MSAVRVGLSLTGSELEFGWCDLLEEARVNDGRIRADGRLPVLFHGILHLLTVRGPLLLPDSPLFRHLGSLLRRYFLSSIVRTNNKKDETFAWFEKRNNILLYERTTNAMASERGAACAASQF
jgi:hypothetical protein